MDLISFFNQNPSAYSDELLFVTATEYCRNLPAERRGNLFYALLNWKDKHQDIQQRCARISTEYEVRWYEKGATQGKIKTFNASNSKHNPMRDARVFYSQLYDNPNIACAELRLKNNDFIPGRDGLGGIVDSFDREFR